MNHDEISKPEKARQADTNERYLAFLVGKEQYAIPLLQVKEVIEMSEPTPIPQAPPHFKGIINLRGQVISVLDLRSKLQIEDIKNGPKTAIIILDLEPALFVGVIVDRINSVLAFHSTDVSPAPDTLSDNTQYLTGVARRDKHLTLILNVRAALTLPEINVAQIQNEIKAS